MNALPRKLETIDSWNGLEADYVGGRYTVTVWHNDLFDDANEYELVFRPSNSFISHKREYASRANLETEMRKWQPDLRRWRKVEYES